MTPSIFPAVESKLLADHADDYAIACLVGAYSPDPKLMPKAYKTLLFTAIRDMFDLTSWRGFARDCHDRGGRRSRQDVPQQSRADGRQAAA